KCGAEGVLGGYPGLSSRHALKRADGTSEILPHKATNLTISAGDTMILETAGGGGWGKPDEREPHLVLQDLLDGKISSESAHDVYKVVLTVDGTAIDWEGTHKARELKL